MAVSLCVFVIMRLWNILRGFISLLFFLLLIIFQATFLDIGNFDEI